VNVACVEAAASARRLAAIAELVRRRADGPTDCAQWFPSDAMARAGGLLPGCGYSVDSGLGGRVGCVTN
jgi:hypothetical protein